MGIDTHRPGYIHWKGLGHPASPQTLWLQEQRQGGQLVKNSLQGGGGREGEQVALWFQSRLLLPITVLLIPSSKIPDPRKVPLRVTLPLCFPGGTPRVITVAPVFPFQL